MATAPAVTPWKAEDKHILSQIYAEVLLVMGYRPDLIVYAVKMFQKEQRTVDSGSLMEELDRFVKIEKSGKTLPPLEEKRKERRKSSSSDGERGYESDNSEYADGAQAANATKNAMPGQGEAASTDASAALRRKLQALRHENQLLKARQLCRSCHQKPVSITFLPCGHYSFCYECGQGFSTCPICRKTILADVKTFLA